MTKWREAISSIRYDDAPLEANRDLLVKSLESSRWFAGSDNVQMLVDELSEVDSVHYFDLVLEALYDEADADKVWLTFVHKEGA